MTNSFTMVIENYEQSKAITIPQDLVTWDDIPNQKILSARDLPVDTWKFLQGNGTKVRTSMTTYFECARSIGRIEEHATTKQGTCGKIKKSDHLERKIELLR
jgi:hypothetical protein